MVTRASISFEHPAIDVPIYVVTEMSTPPWEPLEMRDSGEKTETGDVIFIRNFEDVTEGNYQYKIRIGDSDWVLDTTKDTGSDSDGHLNNIVRATTFNTYEDPSALYAPSIDQEVGEKKERQDSVQSCSDVIHGVQDEEQQGYGELVHEKLPIDMSKRETGANPDRQRDHSGHKASPTENLAEDAQTTDTEQDKATIESENSAKSDDVDISTSRSFDELQNALALPHEAGPATHPQIVSGVSPLVSHERDVDAESEDSSDTEQRWYASNFRTDSDEEVSTLNDFDDDEEISELDRAPTMPHEQHDSAVGGYYDDDGDSDDGPSELDRAPTFAHEFGAGKRRHSLADELELAPRLPHEVLDDEHTNTDPTKKGSGQRTPNASLIEDTDTAKALFGSTSGGFFLPRRATQSTLPHKLARSDAEDENLQDPSLEPFPVDRNQILLRINTARIHLPEDEPEGSMQNAQSPDALSQACSSVDLEPVKSHGSLGSIPESDPKEEEESDPVLSSGDSGLRKELKKDPGRASSLSDDNDNAISTADGAGAISSAAQVLINAREDFLAQGRAIAAELLQQAQSEEVEDEVVELVRARVPRHRYWSERNITPSTISERTEPDSPPPVNAQTIRDDETVQPRQRHQGLLVRLFVAPLRRLFACCLGRDTEDVPQAVCALVTAGILAAASWWMVASGLVSVPKAMFPPPEEYRRILEVLFEANHGGESVDISAAVGSVLVFVVSFFVLGFLRW